MTEFKPFVIITPDNKPAKQFTDLAKAKRYASVNKGQLYRRNDWYEAVRKQCKVLLDMMIELRSEW